ncbi:uncharacterized protein LOC111111019 isoform X2 [Crassostrea virginica]
MDYPQIRRLKDVNDISNRRPLSEDSGFSEEKTNTDNNDQLLSVERSSEVHTTFCTILKERESGFRSYLDIGAEGQSGLSGQKTEAVLIKKLPVRHIFYKPECFPHLMYISKLIRNLTPEVEKVIKIGLSETALRADVIIKITYVGVITDDNLRLVTKRKGKERSSRNKEIWEASPIVCFENGEIKESSFEHLSLKESCHKILVKPKSVPEKTPEKNSMVIVDEDHVRQAIISCLEDPISRVLDKWTQKFETAPQTKHTVRIIKEIRNIRKQMKFEEVIAPESSSHGYEHIVPENVKDYLFSEEQVISFGVWGNACFKIFIKKDADTLNMQRQLTKLNQGFFEKYQIQFENKRLAMKKTMKQGDCILGNKNDNLFEGTLGGFVKENCNSGKIYALTCNHVFPDEEYSAFADDSLQNEIGKCVFSTREKSSDFAAVEMNESADCDVTFRNEEGNKTNARIYDRSIENIGFMHKIGTKSGATTGSIVSPEYYDKLYDEDNREFLFLVGSGDGQPFSEEGDSGALVFSHPLQVEQNYVNVVGMVYGIYQREDERSDDEEGPSNNKEQSSSEEKKRLEVKSQDKTTLLYEREGQPVIDVYADPEHISCCYRLSPALELFEEHRKISVKLKDDISSSGSSLQSSSSDEST